MARMRAGRHRKRRRLVLEIVFCSGIVLNLMAAQAWGQDAPSRGTGAQSPARTAETDAIPPISAPPLASYPLELLGLLAPRAQQGPMTLTPSIAVSETYNDNVFSDNQNRQWDFITTFSPAITLDINRPGYELRAGYSFGADLYARDSSLSNFFNRQNFVANGLYRLTPALTLSGTDSFVYNRDTSLSSQQAISTGRQESWSNNFTSRIAWQMTARNSLSVSANYYALRFLGTGRGTDSGSTDNGTDSDTYGLETLLTHAFT